MQSYLELLRIPGVKRLVLSAFPGRFAYSMITLATYFYVHDVTGSITTAGLATGAETIASSLMAGLRGNAIDKYGQTKPMAIFFPTWTFFLTLMAFVHTPVAIIAIATCVGMTSPPINLSIRPLWRTAVPADQLRTAFALDTTIMNSTTVLGPFVATFAALQISPSVALWLTAGCMFVGGFMMVSMPLARRWVPEAQPHGAFAIFKSYPFMMLAVEGCIFGLGWGLLEIGVPAYSTYIAKSHLAAPLVATLSAASIVGGLVIGSRKNTVTPLKGFKIASLCVALAAAPLAFTSPGFSMGIVLAVLGLAIGFAMVYHWEIVEVVRPVGAAASAQAWLWTLEGSFLAIGTALGGYLVEHVSPTIAIAGVSASLAGASLFTWAHGAKHWQAADRPLSDLETANALADTEITAE